MRKLPWFPLRHLPALGGAVAGLWPGPAPAAESPVHPVVVIPGAPGTFLADPANGQLAWGRMEASLSPDPAGHDRLALPLAPRRGPLGLRDELVPAGVIGRMPVIVGGIRTDWKLYQDVLDAAIPMRGRTPDPGLLACFDYDWRLDIAENGARLHRFLLERRSWLRKERPELFPPGGEVRFDLVTHSMGGLIARYALRYGDLPLEQALADRGGGWRGAALGRKLICLDPPNNGSLASLVRLHEGFSYSRLIARIPAAVLGTMPSVYQVLPGPEAGSVESVHRPGEALPLFDVRTWVEQQWGLAGPAAGESLAAWYPGLTPGRRRVIAITHLDLCLRRAAGLRRALDGSGPPPAGLEFHLLTGTGASTPVRAVFTPGSSSFRVTEHGSGDSVVPASSALWLPGADGSPAADPANWCSVFTSREHHMTGLLDLAWSNRIRRLLRDSARPGNDIRWLHRVAPNRHGPR